MEEQVQMQRLKQSIEADRAKLEAMMKKYAEESGKLRTRLSANRKKLERLENAALIGELRTISAGSGADVREIVAAIRSGNQNKLSRLAQSMTGSETEHE